MDIKKDISHLEKYLIRDEDGNIVGYVYDKNTPKEIKDEIIDLLIEDME